MKRKIPIDLKEGKRTIFIVEYFDRFLMKTISKTVSERELDDLTTRATFAYKSDLKVFRVQTTITEVTSERNK